MKTNLLGKPYFLSRTAPQQYPWLDHDLSCDVAVIGGGMTGAMCAYKFAKADVDMALLSLDPIGHCATAAAEGVATVGIDGGLSKLTGKMGADDAAALYGMFHSAVNIVEQICEEVGGAEQSRCDSLFYSDDKTFIQNEYLTLKHNGYNVSMLDAVTAGEQFSFPVSQGILFHDEAVTLNPYLFTHQLARAAKEHGAQIYENTAVYEINENEEGLKVLYTDHGHTVTAKRIIVAAGIEAAREIHCRPRVMTSFNVVTNPLENLNGFKANTVICNDQIKLRTTPDNRIIVSGLDCVVTPVVPALRLADKKYGELLCRLKEMFPAIHNIQADYTFAYDYISLRNELPVIGEDGDSRVYYAVCPGENGLVFSVLAADLLLGHYFDRSSRELHNFCQCLQKTQR